MSAPVLVFLQVSGGQILPACLEVTGQARLLAQRTNAPLYGMLMEPPDCPKILSGLGFKGIFLYSNQQVPFLATLWGEAALDCIRILQPDIFLLCATPEGRAVAPYVAARADTGLTADCVELSINEDGLLVQTRPAFEGDRMAAVITPRARPQMATVRGGIFPSPVPCNSICPPLIPRVLPSVAIGAEVTEFRHQAPCHPLTEQEVLVAVGGGVRRREDLPLFQALARKLGGTLACSRVLVERGWMSPDRQIGLSGTAVSPRKLLTLGISGSLQFRSGIGGVCELVAVNTDPQAPIFSVADHGLICDLYDVARELTGNKKEV